MGKPNLHDSYYADLTVEQEDPMHENRSAGAYCWVNPNHPRRKASDTILDLVPPVVAPAMDAPTTEIVRPAGSIAEAIHAMLDAEPEPVPRKDRDADPCNCVYCKEARENKVFYVQYDGATVLRPLALIAEVAEVSGADPMRFCPTTDKVVDQDAPVIAPWTTDASPTPVCCLPLRRAVDVDRADVPPFGRTISFKGAGGYLLADRCPWCGTRAAEIIKGAAAR